MDREPNGLWLCRPIPTRLQKRLEEFETFLYWTQTACNHDHRVMCGWSRLTSETITRMWSLRTSVQRTFQLYPSPVFVFRLNSCIVLDVSRVYLPNTVVPPIKKRVQYYYVAYWATSEMAMAWCVHAQRGLFCQDFWAAGGRDALFFPLVCARDVCTEVMCKREHVLGSSNDWFLSRL